MRILIGVLLLVSLVGCSMGHREPVEAKQTLNEAINNAKLPESVQSDLMADFDDELMANNSHKRLRVQARSVDAKTFFAGLVKNTEYSVAVHTGVKGRITTNLTDVTLDEALDTIRNIYGYEIIKEDKVIQVYPAGIRVETIPVDYIQFKRTGRSLTSISTGSVTSDYDGGDSGSSNGDSGSSDGGGSTTIETQTESDFWPQLESTIKSLIGSKGGRSVVVSPQASLVTVRAYPDELREIKRFLGISHERLQRQVILEAKIIEVTLSDGYQQGVNWSNFSHSISSNSGITANRGGGALPVLSALANIGGALGPQTNLTITDGSFDMVLSFMATQGDMNVLSSPRVTAVNNQKAVIKVGQDEFFVTDISSESTVTGSTTTSTPDVELTPFFSGISLDVTPQISDEGDVLLHIHPAVIEVEEDTKTVDLGASIGTIALPLAKSSIRESDSVVRAKDGDVIVIGGLMKDAKFEEVSKVPLLGDIPFLGHLFRSTANVQNKTELVILLKPTVVGVGTWQRELEYSRNTLLSWFPEEDNNETTDNE